MRGDWVARRVVRRLAGAAVLVVSLMSTSSSTAATETSVDCGAGADLQTAINAAPKGAILNISGTCVGSFTVGKNLVFRGRANAVLDAAGRATTLSITGGHVRLSRITITGADNHTSSDAGGIQNAGTLTLFRVTLTGNHTDDGAPALLNTGTVTIQRSLVTRNLGEGYQGAIVNRGTATIEETTISSNDGVGILNFTSSAELTLMASTVDNNGSAPYPGGIWNTGKATIIRSTIANNLSSNSSAGGIGNSGSLAVLESTISGNRADEAGGGIENLGSATLTASIVAGNTAGDDSTPDCNGTSASGGYNLFGTPCADTLPSDLVGTLQEPLDPVLTLLSAHGGPTQTMLPNPASPAINKIPIGATSSDGSLALCPTSGTTDQRGVPRPQGGACDIGSVERKPKGSR
jgi:hypothetical protein